MTDHTTKLYKPDNVFMYTHVSDVCPMYVPDVVPPFDVSDYR
jgi:hypothetical protein